MKTNPYIKLCYPLFELVLMSDKHLQEQKITRELLLNRFNEFEQACHKLSLNFDDINAVKYAMSSLIDEKITTGREALGMPLQLSFFDEHEGGQGFYKRLERIRQQANLPVLEIYHLCLQLGFAGLYFSENKEKRVIIMSELSAQLKGLHQTSGDTLSINAIPSANAFKRTTAKVPTWLWYGALAGGAILLFGLFSVFIEQKSLKSLSNIEQYYQMIIGKSVVTHS